MLNLIHLADDSGRSVSVRILGRAQPGILTGHDFLDAEIVVTAGENLGATFPVTLLPEDLEDWEETLARLEAGEPTRWLDSGRTPSVEFDSPTTGALLVSVRDEPATGAAVTVPLTPLPPTWTADNGVVSPGYARRTPKRWSRRHSARTSGGTATRRRNRRRPAEAGCPDDCQDGR
ncbi:hypothetical protein SUDANB148_03142 [Streptomyces sp. SudanB148_2056]|uniref:DUF5959 family protein n=1 Tax=Streptomyces sp. SudanB148_2056 TaxID=3035280 RepID=UPI003F573FE5